MAKAPPDWAVGPHNDIEPGVKVRPNADGTIDEIFIKHDSFSLHLEQMDDGQYWFCVDWRDGKKSRSQHVMLTRQGAGIYPTVYR